MQQNYNNVGFSYNNEGNNNSNGFGPNNPQGPAMRGNRGGQSFQNGRGGFPGNQMRPPFGPPNMPGVPNQQMMRGQFGRGGFNPRMMAPQQMNPGMYPPGAGMNPQMGFVNSAPVDPSSKKSRKSKKKHRSRRSSSSSGSSDSSKEDEEEYKHPLPGQRKSLGFSRSEIVSLESDGKKHKKKKKHKHQSSNSSGSDSEKRSSKHKRKHNKKSRRRHSSSGSSSDESEQHRQGVADPENVVCYPRDDIYPSFGGQNPALMGEYSGLETAGNEYEAGINEVMKYFIL